MIFIMGQVKIILKANILTWSRKKMHQCSGGLVVWPCLGIYVFVLRSRWIGTFMQEKPDNSSVGSDLSFNQSLWPWFFTFVSANFGNSHNIFFTIWYKHFLLELISVIKVSGFHINRKGQRSGKGPAHSEILLSPTICIPGKFDIQTQVKLECMGSNNMRCRLVNIQCVGNASPCLRCSHAAKEGKDDADVGYATRGECTMWALTLPQRLHTLFNKDFVIHPLWFM